MRTRPLRRTVALAVAAVSVLALPACGERDDRREEVLQIVRSSRRLPGNFSYIDQRDTTKALVQGIVEDDFRVKARVLVDDATAYEQVVYDDKLAMRFLDAGYIDDLVNPSKPVTEATTDIPGVTSLEALEARRWVVAPTGAPYFTAPTEGDAALGRDPVLDAVTVFDYIEGAIRKAASVERFNPDDVTPTYSSSEDNFPEPDDGSGVVRYDLARPDLPPPSLASTGQQESSTPQVQHMRKMAIYVKDGRILQVREAIEMRGKFLEDFRKYFFRLMNEINMNESFREELERDLDRAAPTEVPIMMQYILNGFLSGVGEPLIPFRTMNLELIDLGQPKTISLPTEGVVSGRLDFLITSDAGKVVEEGSTVSSVFSGPNSPGIIKTEVPQGGPGAGGGLGPPAGGGGAGDGDGANGGAGGAGDPGADGGGGAGSGEAPAAEPVPPAGAEPAAPPGG